MLAKSRTSTILPLLLSAVTILVVLGWGGSVTATANKDVAEPSIPLTPGVQDKGSTPFQYVMEGRPDPFVPFITPKATTPKLNPDEIIDEEVELTGMRKFEPGQLTLVAVMETKTRKFAMVEDVTGKGYVIKEGTPIGRRGVVTRIEPDQVLITETAHTRAHKEIKNTIVMRLNKEGEL